MKIIKRNGSEETFNIEKIINAIRKANNSADSPFLTEEQITDIADYVEYKCNKIKRAVSVDPRGNHVGPPWKSRGPQGKSRGPPGDRKSVV